MTEHYVRTYYPRVRLVGDKLLISSTVPSFDWFDGPSPRYFHVDRVGVAVETDEDGNEFFSLLVGHLTSVGGQA